MTVLIDMSEKVVLITGGAGNVGEGICRRFAAAGATVAVHYRSRADAARRLADELGGYAVEAELTDNGAVRGMVDSVVERFGRLDGVVNNAAVQPNAELAAVSTEDWRHMLDNNVTAVQAVSQAAVRVMKEGSITHVASIEGLHPAVNHGHYAVSKAAIIMHSRAAAREWGPRGIRVNSVAPGLIERPGIEQSWPDGVRRWQQAAPLRRLGRPDDIGDACLFLASDLAQWITGQNLVVDGGMVAGTMW